MKQQPVPSTGKGGNREASAPVWRQQQAQRSADAAKAVKSGPKN
jgi:hypothetical protein